MKKPLLFTLCAGLCFGFTAQAQKLTFQQTTGAVPSLTNNLSPVLGWSDEMHYIESDAKTRQLYTVDIKSGERKSYTPPPKSNVNVMVRDSDIYIQYGKDEPKRLTNDRAEEKNPTLSPDGKYVAFTRNSDLFAVDVANGKEIGIQQMQRT